MTAEEKKAAIAKAKGIDKTDDNQNNGFGSVAGSPFKNEANKNSNNSLSLSVPMGFSPGPYQWEAATGVVLQEIKDPTLNLDAISIKPAQKDNFNWMLLYADTLNQMGLNESTTAYMLSSGEYQVEDPKNPGNALHLTASGFIPSRALKLEEGLIVLYYGEIKGTAQKGYQNGMENPTLASVIGNKSALEKFDEDKAMALIKKHENAKKENYKKVIEADKAKIKLPAKGKLSTPELETLGKDMAQSVCRQDNSTFGNSVVMSDNWTITYHALTGMPIYRTAVIAFTQNYKGTCKLQGFRIIQNYDGNGYNETPRFSSIVFDYPFNQNMSCNNL